jgi:UDP-N-acetyl-D-glucosamine dehydrogenase
MNYSVIRKNIIKKNITIGIIGLGYVGLPLAISFLKSGFKVIGFDNNKKKILSLKKRKSYISTIQDKLILKYGKKNFYPTFEFKKILNCNVIIVCVPTPINKNKTPNMEYVRLAVNQLKKYIIKNQVIIMECTSYPGTTEDYFLKIFKKRKLLIGKDIYLGYASEREDPGNKKFSILHKNIPKVVSGYSANCLTLVKLIYSFVAKKVISTQNIKTAEFTKLLENIYRSVNIGLINELSAIASKMKINIYDSIKLAKTKPYGYSAFYPGPGIGGHCIPVDPFYLSWKAKKLGLKASFIELAGKINDARPKYVVNTINKFLLKKKVNRILVLGFSYKKNIDDIRESPAIKIIQYLKKKISKRIFVYDPLINQDSVKFIQRIGVNYLSSINSRILKAFDIGIVITNHDIFDYSLIQKNLKLIFDCRNSFLKTKYKNIIQI